MTVLVTVTIGPGGPRGRRGRAQHRAGTSACRSTPVPRLHDAIVWDLRLPRVLTAAAVGAGLALAGAVMQSLTRNPLADPYLLGLSSGASLGAVAVLVVGVSLLLPVAAFAGALAGPRRDPGARPLGRAPCPRAGPSWPASRCPRWPPPAPASSSSGPPPGDSYREILNWLLGSLAGATWASVAIAGVAVLAVGTRPGAQRHAARRVRVRGHLGGGPRHRRRPHALDPDDGRRAAHRRDGRGQRRDRVRRADPAARGVVADRARAPPAAARSRR